MSTFLLVLLAATASQAAAHSFSKCGDDSLHISAVTLDPDPPVVGKTLSVTFSGQAPKTVAITDGAAAQLEVQVFGITIATVNFDVCKDMGVSCPVAAGAPFKGTVTYQIPSAAPASTSATAKVMVKDASGAALSCVELSVTLAKSSAATATAAATTTKTTVQLMSTLLSVQQASASSSSSVTIPTRSRTEMEFLFEAWRVQFRDHVTIEPKDYADRLDVFAANAAKVERHNAKGHTWTMSLNQFAHMTHDEFTSNYLGYVRPESDVKRISDAPRLRGVRKQALSSEVDWVSAGAVTEVRSQGSCGSCWTFSTTGAIEGAYYLKTGTLTSLSQQQILDCDTTGNACDGGSMDSAFEWVSYNGGLCTYDDYPYVNAGSKTDVDSTCQTSCSIVTGSAPQSYTDVSKTETALMRALEQQPVSVAIEADQDGFQFYSGGVMTGSCGTSLDHGVLAVGYGTSSDGSAYWKVKNSWGTTWGEDGYIRLERGKDQTYGQCGILEMASYPNL